MYRSILLLTVIISCNLFLAYPQNNFSLNSTRESIIFSGAISLGIVDLLLLNNTEPITQEELNDLSLNNINSFDRAAALNFSPAAGDWSDVLLYTTILSPLLLTTSSNVQNNIGPFLTIYFQNTITAYSVSHLLKAATTRLRPYTYNSNIPDEIRMAPDSRHSFFSGHATLAFASAVYLSVTFSEYYPDSNWKAVVWGTSLLTASIVGYLRFAAGAHFPTDIITGTVVGSIIGFLIPHIHKNDDDTNNLVPVSNNEIFSLTIQL